MPKAQINFKLDLQIYIYLEKVLTILYSTRKYYDNLRRESDMSSSKNVNKKQFWRELTSGQRQEGEACRPT
jgi:hypothetical protein